MFIVLLPLKSHLLNDSFSFGGAKVRIIPDIANLFDLSPA